MEMKDIEIDDLIVDDFAMMAKAIKQKDEPEEEKQATE